MDIKELGTNAERVDEFLRNGDYNQALVFLANCIVAATVMPDADKSEPYYLMGNVYRKMGDFDKAINFYTRAIMVDPDSPASEARKVLLGIMHFYNKDMYNH